MLKEGLYEDPERRDVLLKMARFATTAEKETKRSLAEYVAALKPNQTAIYYIAGEGAERIAASPQLEGFRARGVEVLLLSDPVDAFWVQSAVGYDGKPFKSVTQGAADIKSIDLVDGRQADAASRWRRCCFRHSRQTDAGNRGGGCAGVRPSFRKPGLPGGAGIRA